MSYGHKNVGNTDYKYKEKAMIKNKELCKMRGGENNEVLWRRKKERPGEKNIKQGN